MENNTIQLTRMFTEHPEMFLREGAKRQLIWFAKYMRPTFQATPFHKSYYRVLDMFAKGKIKNLIIQAPPQHGKALDINTPVLTTEGWKKHSDLAVGDYVFGEDGKPKRVLWNSGIYPAKTMRVHFADGFSLLAAREHEWKICYEGNTETIISETQNIICANSPHIERKSDNKQFHISQIVEDVDTLVNCIQVEGGMYLAGKESVPTHNSEGSSRFLPAQMLGLNPDLKIAICSYAATIAKDFNRDVQRLIDSEEYKAIFSETQLNGANVVTIADNYLRNSDVFEIVGHLGSLRVVGRGGSLTSKTVDVMIFDDLYKDAGEANSPQIRATAWDWYTKVARTRLHNDSQQLIVFTRWHPEDIIGKILETENVIFAQKWADFEEIPDNTWVLVNFEAIKAGMPTEIDNREMGEALWPERHSLERLLAQKQLDPVGFQCLYQGEPGSAEGKLYEPFKTWIEKADWGKYIRSGCYVDVADEGDDFLFAATYDIYISDNQIWNENKKRYEPLIFALITDVEYTDESTDVTSVTVPRMINMNGTQKAWIESNNGGSQFEKVVKKKVRALTVPFYQGANKESRIVTNAPFVNQQIIMPFGWETRFPKFHKHITEFLRKFDANTHDDDADGLTGIYEKEIVDGNILPYNASHRGVKVR